MRIKRPFNRYEVFLFMLVAAMPALSYAVTTLRVQTDIGSLNIDLYGDTALTQTVDNFLDYVNSNAYEGMILSRYAESPPGSPFVLQTGGYYFDPSAGDFFSGGVQTITPIAANLPILNAYARPNVRGTIAMAKVGAQYDSGGALIPGTGPDSATSEWFINLSDNSTTLDAQNNGGFTVFGTVTGTGMDVIDQVAAFGAAARCYQLFPFPQLCAGGALVEMPVTSLSITVIDDSTFFNVVSIGADADGDGAIDKREDLAANNGDGNNDGIKDNLQQNVASYVSDTGKPVTVVAPVANQINNLNPLGITYGIVTPPDSSSNLALLLSGGLSFDYGYSGYDLAGVSPGGSVNIDMYLPAGSLPNTFYNYGPEPGNPTPHWYEFLYDGTTGAEFNGNKVTLHYVDNQRGDSSLGDSTGALSVCIGGAASTVNIADIDGIDAAIEDAGPNGGDANHDGTLDSSQGNIVSFPDINGNYVLLVTTLPVTPHLVKSLTGSQVDSNLSGNAIGPSILTGYNFSNGFFSVQLRNMGAGGSAQFVLTLPPGVTADTYFMYGPEPGNTTPHWYEFRYDPVTGTGAEINGSVITLHFVDGLRGDSDLDASNGIIADPGGPAQRIGNSGAGGGCSLQPGKTSATQAGAWWLLFLYVLLRFALRAVQVRGDRP